jgi:lipopolysaccharide/colanic/teichoic acid biosynthesis glycosyltransferase
MTRRPRPHARSTDAAARRALDVALALAGLVVLAPAILVIAVTIRIETPGPAFFRQIRVGRGGRCFRLYKFRKFLHGADATGRAVTLINDPRMTRIGWILERTKLDELPQLWNVLVGNMSIVGPRPETLEFADCFRDEYRMVLDHTPGLFGPSQAIFRNESSLYPANRDPHEFYRAVLFPAKARIDLLYFSRRTLVSDFGWIIHGALAVVGFPVFRGEGLSNVEAAENWLRRDRRMSAASVVEERN